MESQWKELYSLRKGSLDLAGSSYSGAFAKLRGLDGKEKGLSGPMPDSELSHEEWVKEMDRLLDKCSLWIPEPVEVKADADGKILCRLNLSFDRRKVQEKFLTSLGTFVSHDEGEFGGHMILPNGKTINGNFCEVIDCNGLVYAIDSCNHMGVGHIAVYALDSSLSPHLLYGRDSWTAFFADLLFSAEENSKDLSGGTKPFRDWLSFDSFYLDNDALYVFLTGQVKARGASKWEDRGRLLLFKDGAFVKAWEFKSLISHVYSMIVENEKIVLGLDKVAAVFDFDGHPLDIFAVIDEEAEKEILQERKRKEKPIRV